MGSLAAHIHDIIRQRGPISIADYMELALQHPEHGYYRKGDPLGQAGDFITAPEISQMFGEMIGLWCVEVWRMMGSPEAFTLLEMGPGRGTLMQDALRATAKISGFHTAMDLCLLESNETLRQMQQKKLAEYLPRWLDDVSELPAQPTIVVANEFFDALPIRQFEKTFQGWCERMVSVTGNEFGFTHWPLDEALVSLIPAPLREGTPGTVYEISMPSLTIMRSLAKHIAQHKGAVLAIDYGYPEAMGKPTLQAVYQHKFADVLKNPGEVDLTAHVDFSALASIVRAQNISITGPVGQGEFLKAMGIEFRAAQLKQRATPDQAAALDMALNRLTNSSEMGTLFKVMAMTSPHLTDLPGF